MKLSEAKKLIKQYLQETDYVMLSDVNLANKADFEKYRENLRGLYLSDDTDIEVVVNAPPDPVWSEGESA